MTNITGFTFLSTDGKTQLHGMRWEPEGRSVRAVLQICHGVAEHIARYDAFARYLNELGIAVVGHDHLGHGRSLPEGAPPSTLGRATRGTPWWTTSTCCTNASGCGIPMCPCALWVTAWARS